MYVQMCAHDNTKYFVRIKIYLWNQYIFYSFHYGYLLVGMAWFCLGLSFFSLSLMMHPIEWINKTWAKCTFNEFEPENACLLIRLLVKRLHFFHLFSPSFIRFRNGVCVCVCVSFRQISCTVIQIMADVRSFVPKAIMMVPFFCCCCCCSLLAGVDLSSLHAQHSH